MRDRRVLVTRPAVRAGTWIAALEAEGAEVVALPLWRLTLPDEPRCQVAARCITEHAVDEGGWLAFTSVAAVEHCLGILDAAGTRPDLSGLRVACVGPATRAACEEQGLTVEAVPDDATGAGLAAAILDRDSAPRVLHAASSMAREELAEGIRRGGGSVEHCVVTEAHPEPGIDAARVAAACENLAVATFASPAAVARLLELAPESVRETPAVAIGATTADALRAGGFQRIVSARSPSLEDFLTAVRTAC